MLKTFAVALALGFAAGAASGALAATAPAASSAKSAPAASAAAPATATAAAPTEAEKSALAKIATPPTVLPPAVARDQGPDTIPYMSNGLMLKAYLYRPQGDGPFPVVLVNHGSEAQPNLNGAMLNFWLSRGFAVFFPIRSGQGGNPGPYIGDGEAAALDQLRAKKISITTAGNDIVALHQKANQDVVAAYKWLVAQPFVDKDRVIVYGGSYGGIQTLLTAQQNAVQKLGIKCFVAVSPAAESWSSYWADTLSSIVRSATTPIMMMQPANDFSLGPSMTLGPLVDAKGFPYRHMVFPDEGDSPDPQVAHGTFIYDPGTWGGDVLAYLADCGELPRTPIVSQ
jgi:carboxymethylenebutenolidase